MAQCLSACGPCAILCDYCANVDERYCQELMKTEIPKAIRLLEAYGYAVSKKEVTDVLDSCSA
jgi:hypothetical protein